MHPLSVFTGVSVPLLHLLSVFTGVSVPLLSVFTGVSFPFTAGDHQKPDLCGMLLSSLVVVDISVEDHDDIFDDNGAFDVGGCGIGVRCF